MGDNATNEAQAKLPPPPPQKKRRRKKTDLHQSILMPPPPSPHSSWPQTPRTEAKKKRAVFTTGGLDRDTHRHTNVSEYSQQAVWTETPTDTPTSENIRYRRSGQRHLQTHQRQRIFATDGLDRDTHTHTNVGEYLLQAVWTETPTHTPTSANLSH